MGHIGSPKTTGHRNRGMSLLEVLIALLVLSIGLIGTAALSLNSLRNVHSALNTSLGSTISLDVEERLWVAITQTLPGCPSAADIDGLLGLAETHWTAGPPFLNLNDLSITRLSYEEDGRSLRVGVEVDWTETRLGNNTETFNYAFSAPCLRPQVNAN
jgi:prepilin-type N-terminal cleavage/methylation domain-containing protein